MKYLLFVFVRKHIRDILEMLCITATDSELLRNRKNIYYIQRITIFAWYAGVIFVQFEFMDVQIT